MVNTINSQPDLNFANDWLNKTREYNNILTKPRQKELLLQRIADLEASKKGQKIKELEQELAKYKKEGQEIAIFFKKECGFTGYQQARNLLKGQTIPQLLQLIQDKEQIINDLQGEINNQDQQKQTLIQQSNQRIQALETEKQEQKYQLTQNAKWQVIENTKWRLKIRPQTEQETQTDLKDKQIVNLINQWNQVAEWAREEGIDINKKWNLKLLKSRLEQKDLQKEQIITELQETIKNQEEKFNQQKTTWETDLQAIANKNLALTEQLESKKNWGDNNIPQLKGEILQQGQNIYHGLKEQIKKARIMWGRKEMEQKLEELDNFFSDKELKIQQEKELQKIKSDLKLATKKLNGEIEWESWETKEGLEKWIKELEEKLQTIERERERDENSEDYETAEEE